MISIDPKKVFGIDPAEALARLNRLSPRQRQVINMTTDGMSSVAIGEALGCTVKTLGSHRTVIYAKLNTDANGCACIVLAARCVPNAVDVFGQHA